MSRPVYAYGPRGGNPHEIVIEISDADARRWAEAEEASRIDPRDRHASGPWVLVEDESTGAPFEVRTVPCGLGCRCAAEARPPVERFVPFHAAPAGWQEDDPDSPGFVLYHGSEDGTDLVYVAFRAGATCAVLPDVDGSGAPTAGWKADRADALSMALEAI